MPHVIRSKAFRRPLAWLTLQAIATTSALLAPLGAQGAPPPVVRDSVVLPANGSETPRWISGYPIIIGSEIVWQGGSRLQPEKDYVIDYNNGRLRLLRVFDPADTILVTFQRLNLDVPTRLSMADQPQPSAGRMTHRPNDVSAPFTPVSYLTAIPLPVPRSQSLKTAPPSRVRWQGFKSFAVTTSNSASADWSQRLELAVDGELVPGLRLNAAVTDRSLASADPRSSGADGSRVGSLDRLFIEVGSDHFHGRWGEMVLDQSQGTLSGRRGSGLSAEWWQHGQRLGAVYARPQGEWARRRIDLRAGESGPYPLSESMGIAHVVPRSTTAWLDGQRLVEGPDQDYTLDPGRGTLTLSPRLSVSDRSVLIIEYERTLDGYQRTIVGSNWFWSDSARARGNALSVSWEGDDPKSGLSGTLTAEQRAQLALDPDGHVAVPGDEVAGDHQGDYRLDIGTAGDSAFVYVGPGNGDRRVRFEWVGQSQGRYRHLVDEAYEFVGSGQGAYEPTLTRGAPASRLAVSESLRLPIHGAGQFAGSWHGLALDQNRLSPGGGSFSSDHDIGWMIGQPVPDSGSKGLAIHWARRDGFSGARARAAQGSGADLDRLVRQWGLRTDRYDNAHNEYDLAMHAPLGRLLSLSGEGGLWRSPPGDATRGTLAGAVRPLRALTGRCAWDWKTATLTNSLSTGHATTYSSSLRFERGKRSMEVGWKQSQSADPSRIFASATDFSAVRWVTMSVAGLIGSARWENSVDSTALAPQRLRESAAQVPIKILHGTSGSGLSMARGERAKGSASYVPYYRGRLSGQWQLPAGAILSAEIQLLHTQAGSQAVRYLPTQIGHGQYRLERGEYIPDPQGDYRRVLVDDGVTGQSAYDGDRRLSFVWRPVIAGSHWTLDLERETHGRFDAAAFQPGVWFFPWTSSERALLAGAQSSVRDADKLSCRPDAATQIDLSSASDLAVIASSSADKTADRNRHWTGELGVRRQLTHRIDAQLGGQYERRRRRGAQDTPIDADARTFHAALGATPHSDIDASLDLRHRADREWITGDRVALWGVKPHLQIHHAGFSAGAGTDLTWTTAEHNQDTFSALLAEGRPAGFSITETAEARWQLPGRVTLNARLSGDQRAIGPDRWRVDIETVARF